MAQTELDKKITDLVNRIRNLECELQAVNYAYNHIDKKYKELLQSTKTNKGGT